MVSSINEKNVRALFSAVYKQALKDYTENKPVTGETKESLKQWLLDEGRITFVPYLRRKEVEEYLEHIR